MDKAQIKSLIATKYQDLDDWVRKQTEEKWILGPEGKWTTSQHIVHLIQSLKPLNRALILPKFFLQYKFGKSNRDTRTYDQVVKRYQEKLSAAGQVVSPFSRNMPLPTIQEKEKILQLLNKQVELLSKRMLRWKESDLDRYILPHPLMGRMPVREILMWTSYHAEHHYKILREKY